MKLPIKIRPVITSECWTYYKLAIMQTSPEFVPWTVNHMRMYTEFTAHSAYGDDGTIYTLEHFNDFLEIEDGNLMSVGENDIIDYLVNKLEEKYYVILDINHYRLYDKTTSDFRLHEILIYGFDTDKKVIYTSLLHNGTFKEFEVEYDTIRKAYSEAYNFFREKPKRLFNRRYSFYGITLLRIRENYKQANAIYDYIERLKAETDDRIYIKYALDELGERTKWSQYVFGVECFKSIVERINVCLYDKKELEEDTWKILDSCLKIYESHNLILNMMEWFSVQVSDDAVAAKTEQYKEYCKRAETVFFLSEKYKITGNLDILRKISTTLMEMYNEEKRFFPEVAEASAKAYIDTFVFSNNNI